MKRPLGILIILLALALIVMIYGNLKEAPIAEEPANLAAIYSCSRLIDCQLPSSLTPLNRLIWGLPFIFSSQSFFQEAKLTIQNETNGQEALAQKLLYEWNQSDKLLNAYRFASIILTLFLIVLVYFWSRELLGQNWALLPAFLIALSPSFLAYGRYLTADIIKTAGVFLGLYCLIKYLNQPSIKKLILLGALFGFIQLLAPLSLTLPLFITALIIIFAFYLIFSPSQFPLVLNNRKTCFLSVIGALITCIIVAAIALSVMFLFYLFIEANFQHQISFEKNHLGVFLQNTTEQLSAHFQFSAPEAQKNVYFLGKLWPQPPFHYLAAMFIFKEPLSFILLFLLGLAIAFQMFAKSIINQPRKNLLADYLKIYFAEAAMVVFVLFYLTFVMLFSSPEGFRDLLPILPLIYILTTSAVKNWPFKHKNTLIIGLVVWFGIESSLAFPHQLAYFNQLTSLGKQNYPVALKSNYDWGQDLKYLAEFVKKNQIQKIAVDYYGGGDPTYYLKNQAVPWSSIQSLPQESNIEWLAISITKLGYAKATIQPPFERLPEEEYRWLQNPEQPFSKAGKTIFIYKLQ